MQDYITKSNYTDFCKCPRLYLFNKQFSRKEKEERLSEYDKKILENGTKVGDIARQYFPDSVTVERENNSNEDMAKRTIELINEGHKVICEASFIDEDLSLFCSVDILVVKELNHVELYEVKSSTKVHDYYIDDISFQYYLLSRKGYKIDKAQILTVNIEYIKNGKLNPQELFVRNDVQIRLNVFDNIKQMKSLPNDVSLVANSNCRSCSYFKDCYKNLPKNNVFQIAGIRNAVEMFNNHVISFEDYLNSSYSHNDTITGKNALFQVEFEQDLNKDNLIDYRTLADGTIINDTKVNQFLNNISYPIYYLDFETIDNVIPELDNTSPYFQRIFQYSLHIEEIENGNLIAKKYLQERVEDNFEEVAKKLIDDLGYKGSIIAYHASFEENRIIELSEKCPKYKDQLLMLLDRFIDLEIPFKKRIIYNKEMVGKTSIKIILPALVKSEEVNYNNLPGCKNGTQAMDSYEKLVNTYGEEHEKIKDSLEKYCGLDTYAMYKIIEYMRNNVI